MGAKLSRVYVALAADRLRRVGICGSRERLECIYLAADVENARNPEDE